MKGKLVLIRPCSSSLYSERGMRGAVILALVAMFVIVMTSAFVASVSLNKIRIEKTMSNARVLQLAKEHLIGYSLRQSPPGLLPCPDTDGDGLSNVTGGSCDSALGLLPYRTLSANTLEDAAGERLWYGVDLVNTREIVGVDLNSSLLPALRLNVVEPVLAVLIAPGLVLGNQQRANLNAIQYLEGVNADGDASTYAYAPSDTNNDELLPLRPEAFWTSIERRVLHAVDTALLAYRDTPGCAQYPWAALNSAPYDSNAGSESGLIPTNNALAYGGAGACPTSLVLDTWFERHWVTQVHYAFCGPSGPACLNISGDLTQTADVLLLSPGIALAGQTRPSNNLADYFELDNSDADADFVYRKSGEHNDAFNDLLEIVVP